MPSMTNCTARVASSTPSTRVKTSVKFLPINLISGPAIINEIHVMISTTTASAANYRASSCDRLSTSDIKISKDAIVPGPAIMGMPMGKTEISSGSPMSSSISSARFSRVLRALFKHHVQADNKQHDTAGNAKGVEANAQFRQTQILRHRQSRTG